MSKNNNQHVLPRGDSWAVHGAGNSRDTSVHATQSGGVAQNKQSEVVIHGRDGRIREKNSYGNDNCPSQG